MDRGLHLVHKLIANRDPATPTEHIVLRVLAWCLFFQEGLRLGDGPPRRDVPDLSIVSPERKAVVWIACGSADAEEIRRVVVHNRGVLVQVLFDETGPRDHFLHQLASIKKRPPGFDDLSIWTIDRALVAGLAARAELRQRWAVTAVADHVYVDSDGVKADSAVVRSPVPAFQS